MVCCGKHEWKVKYHGDYKVMSTMGIIHSDFSKMTIDIGEAVDFPERRWLIRPSSWGLWPPPPFVALPTGSLS